MSLLDPLRHPVAPPPSKVDIRRAMRDGRRRERNRRLAAGGMVAVVVALAGTAALNSPAGSPPAATGNGCTVQRFPTPGNAPGTVDAVDPEGRYATGRLDTDGRILLWVSGALQTIEGEPVDAIPGAVNAAGLVVGSSGTGPWLLRDGTFTPLAAPPDAESVTAVAINAGGDIVGTATAGSDSRIVRWNAAHPDQVAYVTGAGTHTVAAGIGPDGTIVGSAAGAAATFDPQGKPSPLRRPAGGTALNASARAGDWVIGSYEARGTSYNQGLRWNLRTGTAEELEDFVPGAVAATGRMFGSRMAGGDHTPPAMWEDGDVRQLPVLASGQSATVTSSSADGRLAAGWLFKAKNDPIVPVQWSC